MCLPAAIALASRPARICVVAASKKTVSFVSASAASRLVVHARDAVRLGERRQLVLVAPDQDRIGHHAVAVRQQHAALGADGSDGADQVLVGAHAPGHAVHDDAEPSHCHRLPPRHLRAAS